MPTTLSEMDYLAGRPEFVARVRAAMVTAAVSVGTEAEDNTEHGRLRRALSVNVLQNPDLWAPQFARAVATNVAVTIDSTDNDLQFTVNSRWSAMAGAGPDA